MTPRAKAFAAHIDAICDASRIRIEFFDGDEWAAKEDRTIRIRPVRGDRSYAAALHEIGHVLGRWQDRSLLLTETGAWLWAEKNAVAWSETMRDLAAECLEAYLRDVRVTKDYVPPKDHEMFRLIRRERIVGN